MLINVTRKPQDLLLLARGKYCLCQVLSALADLRTEPAETPSRVSVDLEDDDVEKPDTPLQEQDQPEQQVQVY